MTDLAIDPPPIACTLGPGDFQARLAWIAALNARALRGHHRDDLVLHLTYAADAADDIREMIDKEKACCAFLDFATCEDAAGLQLTVTAPEEAREAADLVFEPFVAKTPAKAASSCGGRDGVPA
jgi:hypothetical protein